jgi:hypothetical protein
MMDLVTGPLVRCWCEGKCRYQPVDQEDDGMCWRHGDPAEEEGDDG